MTIRNRSWLQTRIGRDLTRGKKHVKELSYSTYQYLKDIIDSHADIDKWDDLRAPFSQTRRGALSKPDFDYTNVGLLFPQNDATEITYIIMQLPHAYKLGTNIRPHLHWQQMNSNSVVWKFDYKWFENGGLVPANFTTVTATGKAFTYSAGNLLQIETFPELDGSSITGVSSILLLKIYREDDVDGGAGGGDALAFEFDIHYQVDSLGSTQEYTKQTIT